MAGRLVTIPGASTPVWDIAGDGSQGYCKAVAVIAGGGGGGSGTVTSVSVTTANGVSGTVATATTTPAITLVLGAITPTSVNGNTITAGTGTLTLSTFTLTVAGNASVSGTNTGDQASVTSISSPNSTLTIASPTTTPTVDINLANPNTWTGLQTHKISDGVTSAVTNVLVLGHNSSGTTAANFGTGLLFQGRQSTTNDVNMCAINSVFTNVTSKTTQLQFQTISAAGTLSTGLTIGSGISGATAGLIIGGYSGNTLGGLWNSLVSPSGTNYALGTASTVTALNVASGGILQLTVGASAGTISQLTSANGWQHVNPSTTTITAIGTAQTVGNTLVNTSAATVSVTQNSPMSVWQGQGWQIGTGGTMPVAFGVQVVPVQGGAAPTGNWVLSSNINSVGYNACMTVSSTGTVTIPGNFATSAIGSGLQIKTGINSRIGIGTLSGGTLTVANTSVTANTRVFLSDTTSGSLTNVGNLTVVTTAGVGFVVTSTNPLDTSTFNWVLHESIP